MKDQPTMSRPATALIRSPSSETIEVVEMGHVLVLMQADELGDVQNVAIDVEQARQLLPILQQIVGGR